jgi:GMP synthase (glutamine-hydrolysing)
MDRIINLKVGSTLPSLIPKKGDFEDWIIVGMGLAKDRQLVIDLPNGATLPAYEEISGIVITGSHDNVTDHHEWSERLAGWLPEAVERRIPILGICYGHQLLAYALGGEVGDNPVGWEFGTVDAHLTSDASGDALLGRLETPIKVHVTHTQTVLRLPEKARRLALSEKDGNQAFVVGDCAWGVQFHPEYDTEVVKEYIRQHKKILLRQGQDPDELMARSVDTSYGGEILRRFVAIVNKTNRT